MVNEENVKHLLTSWLNTFNVDVLWEKKNKWNYPVFKSDSISKPDLIISKYSMSFAVEVKDADSGSMNILDSFTQILKYARTGSPYYIPNKEIIPTGFLVATQNSINGHLFNGEGIKPVDKGRQFAIDRQQVPKSEYEQTLNFVRLLWRNAKAQDIDIPTGALLSNILNTDYNIAPMLFFKTHKWSSYIIWDKL